jgi:hypothetical protein
MPVDFSLGDEVEVHEAKGREQLQDKKQHEREAEIINLLQSNGGSLEQSEVLKAIKGKTNMTIDALKQMTQDCIITRSGKPLIISLARSESEGGRMGGLEIWKLANIGSAARLLEPA